MSSELPSQLSCFISTPDANKFKNISFVDKDGNVHYVSKIIMAAHSNVLHSIFTYESDKFKTNFSLPTISGISLVLILHWIESGELALTWNNVLDVLETAEFLDIPLACSFCQEWLEARMTTDKVLGIWKFAKNHFLQDLEKINLKCIKSRLLRFIKRRDFLT